MRLICRKLLVAALAAAVGAQDVSHPSVAGECPQGLSGTLFVHSQSCYEFNGVEKTWVQARAHCYERDGRLASIMDAGLQAWLSNTSARLWPTQNGVWIGLNDRSKSGVFLWDDYGTNAEHQMSYSNWASGYPGNGLLSGDCVHMRSDNNWQWLENTCDSFFELYIYTYICEYPTSKINATSPGGPAVASVEQVTLPVDSLTPDTLSVGSLTPEAGHWFTTNYPLAFLSSPASNLATHDSSLTSPNYFGTVASKSDVTVPLAVSVAVVVVIVALIALAVVVKRRQQRSRLLKGSTVSWTRSDDDESTMVDNPMYGDGAQLAVDQATKTHCGDSDGLPGRPESNSNAEASYAVSVVRNQEDCADGCSSDLNTGEIYSEPLMQGTSAAIAAETETQYQQYACMNTASFLQQPGMAVRDAVSIDSSQQRSHEQQLNGSRSIQDDYEPFVANVTHYENVQKPDARNL